MAFKRLAVFLSCWQQARPQQVIFFATAFIYIYSFSRSMVSRIARCTNAFTDSFLWFACASIACFSSGETRIPIRSNLAWYFLLALSWDDDVAIVSPPLSCLPTLYSTYLLLAICDLFYSPFDILAPNASSNFVIASFCIEG